DWTVAIDRGGWRRGADTERAIAPGVSVKMLQRKPERQHEDRYSIGRLMSPRDEAIDLDENAWKVALEVTRLAWSSDPARAGRDEPASPNGPAIRRVRGFGSHNVEAHPDRGVLLLYVLDPKLGGFPEDTPPVVGFGISFPGSNSGVKVEYKVNNILWEQEYG
ncbi:endonuclease, partial [mine drainage metagenome]